MKSFLSLERSATFTCRKNGVERKYLVYEGEEFVNYDLIHSTSTDKPNGVKAEIMITDWNEKSNFVSKAKQKLAYYDTAVLVIDNVPVKNDIHRSEDFQYSTLNQSSNMHISLKDVYYPIDWEALGIKPIDMAIALRFSLKDGITPTPSRESYITNDKTKKLILDKITKVANWHINKYNETVKLFPSFLEAHDYIGNSNYVVNNMSINSIVKYGTVFINKLMITGISVNDAIFYKNQVEHLFTEYEIAGYLNGRGTITKNNRHISKVQHVVRNKNKTVLVGSDFIGNVKEFLKQKYKPDTLFLRRNSFVRKIGTKNDTQGWESYRSILNLGAHNRPYWRAKISEFNYVISTIVSTFADETGVSQSKEFIKWLEDKREAQKQLRLLNATKGVYNGLNKQQGDVTIAYDYESLRGVSFKKKAVPISSLTQNKYLTVVIPEDYPELDMIKKIIAVMKCPNIKFATLGKKEMKKIPDHYQFINIDKFMSIDCKPFMRLASAILFKGVLNDLNEVKSNRGGLFSKFIRHLDADERILRDYVNKHYTGSVDDKAQEYIKNVAETNKLYDMEFWEHYLRVKENIKKYDFINLLNSPPSWDKEKEKRYNTLITQILYFRHKFYNDLPEGTKIVFQ